MDITEVRLRLVENARNSKLKAFASITLDRAFVVHDLKVIQGTKGLFVAMPSRKGPAGDFKDIAHPIDQGTREQVTRKVLAEYDRQVKRGVPAARLEEDVPLPPETPV